MSDIKLTLSLPEINLILESLGQMPYVRVYELIAKIQMQAQSQFHNDSAHTQLVANANGHQTEDKDER
jgi:hypothetical protein